MRMKEVDAITSLGRVLAGPLPLQTLPYSVTLAVFECEADAGLVVEAWRRALDADTQQEWANPLLRSIFLAALSRTFEHVRTHSQAALATALSALTSRNGAPLNVAGTRRELFTRAAEALFKEGRRKPADPLFNQMLVVSEDLFTDVISEYGPRAKPPFKRAWYGMRGVCRLMLSSNGKGDGKSVDARSWMEAADDLEAAFNLGNRGPSAATYLLDALLHWMEYEYGGQSGPETRFTNILARLDDQELSCRAVQALVGRYHFTRWFHEQGQVDMLESAMAHLDASLSYPVQLAYEDHFVRHVRGQVGVRLAIALRDQAMALAEQVAQRAIEDLSWACETNPDAYGGHPSLPSVLQLRAEWHSRDGAFDSARSDLRMVLEDPRLQGAPQELRDQARGRLAQVDLSEGLHTGDAESLTVALRDIAASPPRAGLNWLVFALAAKRVFMAAAESPPNGDLLEQVITCLENHIPSDEHPLDHRRQHQSHLAGLMMYLVRHYRPDLWPVALERFDEAVTSFSDEAVPSELMALYADFQLQTAKGLLTQGQETLAEELLFEAARAFSALADGTELSEASNTFKLDVAHSKAGEALYRLATLTGDRQNVNSAIRHFELAQVQGNDTHHLLGLLGDAYYRKHRLTRDSTALDKAVEFKQRARTRGGGTRENLSLSGRLHFFRWQLKGDMADLVTSVDLVAQASAIDLSWPWPPFQLHEYLSNLPDLVRGNLVAQAAHVRPNDELLTLTVRDGVESLARAGSLRVLNNEEFQRKLLGGRSGVYVLADPHGLLGSSYVFKHTDPVNAKRDVESVEKFGAFLRTAGLPPVLLPSTLTLVPDPDGNGVVQVMRRAKGFQLGQLAIRAAKAGTTPDTRALRVAACCLAAYHAWGTRERPGTASLRGFMMQEAKGRLVEVVRALPVTTAQLLTRIGAVPAVRKKDAHPENWLVDEDGRLVMIDFESSKGQPVLYDMALLLDDYPFLPIDRAGWFERMARCHEYIDTLRVLSATIPDTLRDEVADMYGVCVAFRCAVNVQRLRYPSDDDRASSSTRAGRLRRAHAEGLLGFLAAEHASEGVRDFAGALSARLLGSSEQLHS